MGRNIQDAHTDFLCDAFLSLHTREECYRFLEDICTVQEIKAMSQRIAVAKLLQDGLVYNEIVEKTGASTATISRVKRSLDYGEDAYPMVFDRLQQR